MEESQLQYENRVLKDEVLELHRKVEELRSSNNWLYGQLLTHMEDKFRQLDPANYAMSTLILN